MSHNQLLHDEITFWSRQIFDHLKFLRQLITDPDLSEALEDVINNWCDVLSQPNVKFNPQNQKSAVTKINKFFTNIKKKVLEGKNLGFLFPSFLNHMIEEQEYYLDILNGEKDIIKEGTFWKNELIEHTSLIAHLLDPKEDDIAFDLLKDLQNLKMKPIKLSELIRIMESYINLTKKLRDDNKITDNIKPPYFSLLSRPMYDHEIREMEHGVIRLSRYESAEM